MDKAIELVPWWPVFENVLIFEINGGALYAHISRSDYADPLFRTIDTIFGDFGVLRRLPNFKKHKRLECGHKPKNMVT